MFLKSEITDFNSLYANVNDDNIEDFLDDREVELIKQKGLTYYNLRNYLFVPKHHEKLGSTIRFQRLWTDDFDLGKWLNQIGDELAISPDTTIEISNSFICKVGISDKKTYMFAAKSLAAHSRKISSYNEFQEFANEIEQYSYYDHLHKAFWDANDMNRFHQSGWIPFKLVCNYIWITK